MWAAGNLRCLLISSSSGLWALPPSSHTLLLVSRSAFTVFSSASPFPFIGRTLASLNQEPAVLPKEDILIRLCLQRSHFCVWSHSLTGGDTVHKSGVEDRRMVSLATGTEASGASRCWRVRTALQCLLFGPSSVVTALQQWPRLTLQDQGCSLGVRNRNECAVM